MKKNYANLHVNRSLAIIIVPLTVSSVVVAFSSLSSFADIVPVKENSSRWVVCIHMGNVTISIVLVKLSIYGVVFLYFVTIPVI